MGVPGVLGWLGEYQLVSRLGSGGMGEVYLARSAGGRAVAVKTVHPHLAEDPEFRRRFAREAEAAARVGGAFTAPVLDADAEARVPWLATAFVAGPSIAEAVAAAGPLPTGSVRTVGAGLAEALLSIHGAGTTHRDLKPANVLLSAAGPRIIDFGLARAEDATALTDTGQAVGTPGYLPPEVLEGGEAGPAGDVFALGGVLAFAATGRHPYGGGPVAAILRRVLREPPDLAGIEPRTRALLAACLSTAPGDRPAVGELLVELGATDATGGPAPLPRAVSDLISERESWARGQLARAFEGETRIPGTEPEPGLEPTPPLPGQDHVVPAPVSERRSAPRLMRSRTRTGWVVGAAVALALVVAAAYLLPRLWPGTGDTPDYTLVAEHEIDLPSFEGLALSPDGGTVYLKGPETPVLAVDSRSGESLFTSEQAAPGGISVSPDGAFLAVHGSDAVSRLREPEDNRDPVLILDAADGRTLMETAVGAKGGDTAFTPDGRLVVTSVWGGTGLWDVRSGTRVSAIAPTGGEDLAVSSDGSLVAFLRDGRTALLQGAEENSGQKAEIEVWTVEGEQKAVIEVGEGPSFRSVDFQPGTSLLAAAGGAGLRMWDARTGEALGGFDHGLGSAAAGIVDGATGTMLLWAHGEAPIAVDLDARAPLGPVLATAGEDTAASAEETLYLALSADGGVLVSVERGFDEDGEAEGPGRLYVWERA
ncbi:WD40 repeat domain-containing serine/threonine protein kinase [Nocardiopsis ganjiahuensis]|uniref:WD40 repeat domain-containing serine/threonine protein kinase n=1 Tax=Nocardiopsis ganjiahuensis TaxID=239984 RepID=UPI00034AC19C|nr:WD40 repeat domain-containing serine/threonine protein kinase [Nocardiopsis ganjiahuensis]